MYILGIDIGGTFIKYAYFDRDLKIVKKWNKKSIPFDKANDFYNYICEDIDKDIIYVGISAPGVIDRESNVLSKAADTIKIMYQTNINKEIKKRLNCPVYTLNDAKAAAKCEYEIGNSKGTKSSVYVLIGTGVGGCVHLNGEFIEGNDLIAGELSFLPFTIKENHSISVSHFASMSALIDIYNKKIGTNSCQYGKEICELYLKGNQVAIEAINEWCRNISYILLVLTICYNPNIICIGGGISEEEWFIEKINGFFKEMLPPRIKHLITTQIKKCQFNNDANLIGAVLNAKEKIEK